MKVLICWSNISGYMAACWRELAARDGVELRVVAFQPGGNKNAPFDPSVLHGIDHTLVNADDPGEVDRVLATEEARSPDVAVVPGWFHPSYVRAAGRLKAKNVPVFMTIDHGWEGTLRQRASAVAHRRYVRGMVGVFVGGERSRQYALKLGAPPERIHRALYGFDAAAFAPLHEERRQRFATPPRNFLFIGRYVDAKGIDVLVEAYGLYREAVQDPWTLSCCGRGPRAELLAGQEGITDHGFTQPEALGEHLLNAGAFVLPSRFEPWGVVVAEAAASGLPVICSQAVGASVELVHDYYNGITVPTADAGALERAMCWMHQLNVEERRRMGVASAGAASAYSAERWTDRWEAVLRREG